MKTTLFISLMIVFSCTKQTAQTIDPINEPVALANSKKSFLALGDSYTIGQSVAPIERFPTQTTQKLAAYNIAFDTPEYIAATGWTTNNLISAINSNPPQKPTYDFVTLLIGVNNQYQGRTQQEYANQFSSLLNTAILYAGNKPNKVVVLSIPDWGVTPFASGYDRALIARQIDSFNVINYQISVQKNVHYINITPSTRLAASDPSLLANDGLHPSATEYAKWATMLSDTIKATF
jgi:lysophospholipase L1-like esterase